MNFLQPGSLQFNLKEKRIILLPSLVCGLTLSALFIINAGAAGSPGIRLLCLVAGVVNLVYIASIALLLPKSEQHPLLKMAASVLNGLLVGLGTVIFSAEYIAPVHLIYTVLLATDALLKQRYAYVLAGMVGITYFFMPVNVSRFADANFVIQVLYMVPLTIAITETIVFMMHHFYVRVKRMEIINLVSQNLASTIEINQVTSLLSSTIQSVMEADTYFLGLIKDGRLWLELLYDEGEFFSPQEWPMENSTAGWVIKNRRSILVNDMDAELPTMGIKRFYLGSHRLNKSWIGAPLISGDRVLGVVAVSSYSYNAFTRNDLELLDSIAQLASMAIDNAFHHAEVERQSRLDSLTGVLNHGSFLEELERSLEDARVMGIPVSLIMLDIDFFKQYNDTYGHLVGDVVLSRLTDTIRSHVKSTDLVGRWGGEEFAIALINATGAQAYQVAERIRETMHHLTLLNTEGAAIPSATVSQGIALFPSEAEHHGKLIDLADRRLYIAKERGRDQVEPVF